MQPATHAMTMTTRDLASGFANGHRALPPDLHAVLFFLPKDGDQHRQNPEAHQGERSSSGNGPTHALLFHRRREPHGPNEPRSGRAVCPHPLADRWKPRSEPGRAEPRARGAHSRPGNRPVCVRGSRPQGQRPSCRPAARTRAHNPAPSRLPDPHSVSASTILAGGCHQPCATSGCS
jgi:hypothetical protein